MSIPDLVNLDDLAIEIPEESNLTLEDVYQALYNSTVPEISPSDDNPFFGFNDDNNIVPNTQDVENPIISTFPNDIVQSATILQTNSGDNNSQETPRPPTPFVYAEDSDEEDIIDANNIQSDTYYTDIPFLEDMSEQFRQINDFIRQSMTRPPTSQPRPHLFSPTNPFSRIMCPQHNPYRAQRPRDNTHQQQPNPVPPFQTYQAPSDTDESFRDTNPRITPSNFNMSTFHKVIPSYDGTSTKLNIFLTRCDTYYQSLNAQGRQEFLDNIIYKLDDTAHIIYKSKQYTDWRALRKDLSKGIAEQKSLPTLQTELLTLRQTPNQTVGDFSDNIRRKLNILNDKIKEISEDTTVQQTFQKQNDQMACRALKEGVRPLLRQRLTISPDTTFENLRQLALEEEPYTLQQFNNNDRFIPNNNNRNFRNNYNRAPNNVYTMSQYNNSSASYRPGYQTYHNKENYPPNNQHIFQRTAYRLPPNHNR